MTTSNESKPVLARVIREPMAAFALAGGLLFWIYGAMAGDASPAIVVEEHVLERLVTDRELVLERELTTDEIEIVRQNFIDQEVLVREAMARRLYLNDGQVRHRLADKMFYLLADEVASPQPDELYAFYERNRSRYRTPETISFSQRFYGDDRVRAARTSGNAPANEGVRFYMGNRFDDYAPQELIAIFGIEFTRAIGELPHDEWSVPIRSDRGWHRVHVTGRKPRAEIPVEALGDRLTLDWREEQLAMQRRRKLDSLRENYAIAGDAGD